MEENWKEHHSTQVMFYFKGQTSFLTLRNQSTSLYKKYRVFYVLRRTMRKLVLMYEGYYCFSQTKFWLDEFCDQINSAQ